MTTHLFASQTVLTYQLPKEGAAKFSSISSSAQDKRYTVFNKGDQSTWIHIDLRRLNDMELMSRTILVGDFASGFFSLNFATPYREAFHK